MKKFRIYLKRKKNGGKHGGIKIQYVKNGYCMRQYQEEDIVHITLRQWVKSLRTKSMNYGISTTGMVMFISGFTYLISAEHEGTTITPQMDNETIPSALEECRFG